MSGPRRLDLTPEKIESLISRIESQELKAEDYPLLADLIRAMIWMQGVLIEKKLSIARLRKVFGIKTESAKALLNIVNGTPPSNNNGTSSQNDLGGSTTDQAANENSPGNEESLEKNKRKGNGHRSSKEYQEAKIIKIAHESLKRGDVCPKCGSGKLFNLKPGTVLRIVGQPWLQVEIYKPERLRCAKCQQIFTAKLPSEIYTQSRADHSAKAIVTLLKYRGGVPFYRQEKIQEALGNPISDSEIWEMTANVADCGLPVFAKLCQIAANGECIHNDDTNAKILELLKENERDDPERKGIFTSAILSKNGDKQISIFFTGRQHAGENIDDLLNDRDGDLSIPIQMCDGLSRNIPKKNETQVGKCNAHSRRYFYEIAPFWPNESLKVVSAFDLVFLHDKIAKNEKMSIEERLKWHQKMSLPVMKEIRKYCQQLIKDKKIEPNSSFGKAIQYLENHWNGLTLFTKIPGVPISNNDDERLIKRCVLNRKNAYFFKTQKGARIADILMSLIETCCLNKINPYNYLLAIQKFQDQVFNNPNNWLPWNYHIAMPDTS